MFLNNTRNEFKFSKWSKNSLYERLTKSYILQLTCIETLDTIGKCQRPVFSPGESQHKYA